MLKSKSTYLIDSNKSLWLNSYYYTMYYSISKIYLCKIYFSSTEIVYEYKVKILDLRVDKEGQE